MRTLALLISGAILIAPLRAQERADKVLFEVEKDAKLDGIRAELRKKAEEPERKTMGVDFASLDAPKAVSEPTPLAAAIVRGSRAFGIYSSLVGGGTHAQVGQSRSVAWGLLSGPCKLRHATV